MIECLRSERISYNIAIRGTDLTAAFTIAVLSAHIVPPTDTQVNMVYHDVVEIYTPYEAFSTLAPLIILPSGVRKAAPTGNFE